MNQELDERRRELGRYLKPYLEQLGFQLTQSNQISCCLGTHQDVHPSMHLMKPDFNKLYCFTCGRTADIFDIAHIRENKPLRGKGFIDENLNYLSRKFGLKPLELSLTEKEESELKAERIQRVAAGLFRRRSTNENALKRGWHDEQTLRRMGVGTLADKDGFIEAIMRETKCSKDELKEAGMDFRMFAANQLVFTLENENGECIGFAARNMDYELVRKADPEDKIQKFLNPNSNAPLYDKGVFLYNAHRARKAKLGILVEGYADPVTCESYGIAGCFGIGSATSFTKEKAEAMIRCGLTNIVICLDYDFGKINPTTGLPVRAGQLGTIKALKVLRDFPDIRVRIIDWVPLLKDFREKRPEATSIDVDSCIQVLGPERFKAALFAAVPALQFQIADMRDQGITDPADIVRAIVPLIAATDDPLEVPDQIKLLVAETGYDLDLVTEAVKRERELRDRDRLRLLDDAVSKTFKKLTSTKSITDRIHLLRSLNQTAEEMDPTIQFSNTEHDLKRIEKIEQSLYAAKSNKARTGLDFFDADTDGGVPLYASYMIFPGDSQAGKTMLLQRMVHNILVHNPDVDVAVMTIDDAVEDYLQRLWCAHSNIFLPKCANPRKYIVEAQNTEEFKKFKEAQDWVRSMVESRRLILKDGSFGNDVHTARRIIEQHHKRSSRPLILVIDGFHKLRNTSEVEEMDFVTGEILRISQEFNVCLMLTAELRKHGIDNGRNTAVPTPEEIRGSKRLFYDCKYCMILDNVKHRMPFRPDLVKDDGKAYKSYKDIHNTHWSPDWLTKDGRKPIFPVLWLHRYKNKLFSEDGSAEKMMYAKFMPLLLSFDTWRDGDEFKIVE